MESISLYSRLRWMNCLSYTMVVFLLGRIYVGTKDRNFLNVTICSYRNLRSTLLILDFKKTNPSWKRDVENKRFL